MSGWDDFLMWAERCADPGRLATERDRGLRAAQVMTHALDACRAGSPDWADRLEGAFRARGVTSAWLRMSLRDALREHPEDVRLAVVALADNGTTAGIDAFAADITSLGIPRFTIGPVAQFASMVLAGIDPVAYPPSHANATKQWSRLVGASRHATSRELYELFLALNQHLVEAWGERQPHLADLVDAWNLAWSTLRADPPPDWPAEDRAALMAWRKGRVLTGGSRGRAVTSRAWLVRVDDGGASLLRSWLGDGFVSLSASRLEPLGADVTADDVARAVKEGYTHIDRYQLKTTTDVYRAFLLTLSEDDLVATVFDNELHVGVVTGGWEFTDVAGSRLRRDVDWSSRAHPTGDLPDSLGSLLTQQGALVEITDGYEALARLLEAEDADEYEDARSPSAPVVEPVPRLPVVTEELAASLFMPREPLQEIVDLLRERHQLVLYGPPGTGKTFLARRLASHLTTDPSRVRLVQFHPSYSYEDFFEGYRPYETDAGQPAFELQPGPLRLIADEARRPENAGEVFVLIIDEMNRANLAKVFGELYFLLEYRNEAIQLQYRVRGEEQRLFRLPRNLFIIGTMNTADRSIALVDAAIRRRFPFVELHPSTPPVDGVLEEYVRRNGITDGRAALLRALNAAIGVDGHDLHIGPSYLMRAGLDRPEALERVWRYDILPLLEEHFYGQKTREELDREFGIEALRATIAPDRATETEFDHGVSAGERPALAPGSAAPQVSDGPQSSPQ